MSASRVLIRPSSDCVNNSNREGVVIFGSTSLTSSNKSARPAHVHVEWDRARTRVKRIKCASAQFFLRSVHICCTLFLAYVLYGAAGWLQHPPSAVPVPKAASLLRLLSATRVPCARSGVVGWRVTAASWQAHAGGLRRRTLPTRADAGSAATSTTTCSSASIPAWISPTARARRSSRRRSERRCSICTPTR